MPVRNAVLTLKDPKRLPGVFQVVLSALTVGLTTLFVYALQIYLYKHTADRHVRPFGILYLLPTAIVTRCYGKRLGLFTLGASSIAMIWFLMPPDYGLTISDPRDIAESIVFGVVGVILIVAVDAMRNNIKLMEKLGSADAEMRDVGQRQQLLLRELLASATGRRLKVCESVSDLPPRRLSCGPRVPISLQNVRSLCSAVRDVAVQLGSTEDKMFSLLTAVSEAAMNAAVHGGGGEGFVCWDSDGTVQVWVEDHGRGMIPIERVSQEMAMDGAGLGYLLMLNTVERIWVMSKSTGTTVVLQHNLVSDTSLD